MKTNHYPTANLFWTLQAGGWLAFALAMAVGWIGEKPIALIVATAGSLATIGFAVTLAMRLLYTRIPRDATPLPLMAVVVVASSYLCAMVWTVAHHLVCRGPIAALLATSPEPALEFRGPLLDNTVYNTSVLLAWSVLYFGIKDYRGMMEARERALRAEAQAHRAHLRALRYQLNPHFLFNTMNAISTLVGEERNREARSMISRLSDFLRLTLEGSDAAETPLAQEMDFVERYLAIEKVRFGDRLRIRFDIPEELLSAMVPVLVLQPIVENAVRHAVSPREEGACIAIRAHRSGGALLLHVTDDGPGLTPRDGAAGHGIGLANTRERLRELYGDQAALTLAPREEGGLEVTIRVPLRVAPPEPALAALAAV